MKFIKLKNLNSQEFKKAWEIYESSFPSDERRTLDLQKELIKNKIYNFSIVLKDKMAVAIIASWNLEDSLFIGHFAVREDSRGRGIGTKLLREYLSENKYNVVLETERPETEIAIKRIRFYEKIGFKLNNFDYIQPSYGKGKNPVPMFLMTYPEKITKSEFSKIREKLHTIVYGLEKPIISIK